MTTFELIYGILLGLLLISFAAGMLYVQLKYDTDPKEDTK